MKTLLLGATVLGLAAAMNFPPAHAEGLKPSGRTTWPGISQRVDHSDSAIAALPASGGPDASGSGVAPGGPWCARRPGCDRDREEKGVAVPLCGSPTSLGGALGSCRTAPRSSDSGQRAVSGSNGFWRATLTPMLK